MLLGARQECDELGFHCKVGDCLMIRDTDVDPKTQKNSTCKQVVLMTRLILI